MLKTMALMSRAVRAHSQSELTQALRKPGGVSQDYREICWLVLFYRWQMHPEPFPKLNSKLINQNQKG